MPQRLLGPMVFPLDRLMAILGILLEEHDADSRPDLPELEAALSGEYTELELGRVHVLGAVRFSLLSVSPIPSSHLRLFPHPSITYFLHFSSAEPNHLLRRLRYE